MRCIILLLCVYTNTCPAARFICLPNDLSFCFPYTSNGNESSKVLERITSSYLSLSINPSSQSLLNVRGYAEVIAGDTGGDEISRSTFAEGDVHERQVSNRNKKIDCYNIEGILHINTLQVQLFQTYWPSPTSSMRGREEAMLEGIDSDVDTANEEQEAARRREGDADEDHLQVPGTLNKDGALQELHGCGNNAVGSTILASINRPPASSASSRIKKDKAYSGKVRITDTSINLFGTLVR
jgi:hypothetical protein